MSVGNKKTAPDPIVGRQSHTITKTRATAQPRAVKPFDRSCSRLVYVIGTANLRKRGEITNLNA